MGAHIDKNSGENENIDKINEKKIDRVVTSPNVDTCLCLDISILSSSVLEKPKYFNWNSFQIFYKNQW